MDIPLSGNTKDVSLVKILVDLNRNRKTGTLSLRTPSFTKNIYIHSGDAIFASSTYPDDRLGEMLLKAGKITIEQYDRSVELLKATKKRQGAILVELGYLTPKDLFWGVKYQVKEIIHSMFQVEDAAYQFKAGEIPAQEVITLKMSMGNLIYEGVKRIDNWTRIRKEMPDMEAVLRLGADPLHLFQDIELSPQDRKILLMIDGKKTIKDIMDASWMGSFEAMKILYVLWAIGIVEEGRVTEEAAEKGREEAVAAQDIFRPLPEEEEAFLRKVDSLHARLGSISKAALLLVDETTDSETVKKNYYRLAKEFHPDRFFATADASVKDKLTAIFDEVTNAYHALKDKRSRAAYFRSGDTNKGHAPSDDTAKAEEQFKRGVAEFKKGNYWGAVDHFKWAVKLTAGNAKYWSYLSLAHSKIPGRLKDAEEALLSAIKLEPGNADYQANLGLIYLQSGLEKRAVTAFTKALKIDPQNQKAKKGLDQAAETKGGSRKKG